MNEFIIQWYSRSIFNFQPFEIKQLFRKIETKSKQLITNNLHQEFNNIAIYIYTFASPVKCVFEPSKENKSKTINARRKTRTVLESASNFAQNFVSRFSSFFFFFFFDDD